MSATKSTSSKPSAPSRARTIKASQQVEKRERLTRKKRWETQDEDETYAADTARPRCRQPGPNPHRHPHLPRQAARDFPGPRRSAQDSHLRQDRQPRRRHHPDRPRGVRRRATTSARRSPTRPTEDPKSVLAQFRNDYNPRIAVTVDMIATGTDVKPLECLLFMRDVKSRNYFEQMKGRGTRTLDARRPEKGHALRCDRKDALCHRRRHRRHEVPQDRQPAAHHQAFRSAEGPCHGRDDGRRATRIRSARLPDALRA